MVWIIPHRVIAFTGHINVPCVVVCIITNVSSIQNRYWQRAVISTTVRGQADDSNILHSIITRINQSCTKCAFPRTNKWIWISNRTSYFVVRRGPKSHACDRPDRDNESILRATRKVNIEIVWCSTPHHNRRLPSTPLLMMRKCRTSPFLFYCLAY